jgi:GNAT superfamily N-acetyltransferase
VVSAVEQAAWGVEISEESFSGLDEYATVPIAFKVSHVLDVVEDGRGLTLRERQLEGRSYTKDYDATPGEGPRYWAEHFDLSNWGFFAARRGSRWVGGAAVAWRSSGVALLEGRTDLAVLWDIRVAPHARGLGIGTALFRAAEEWASRRGCTQLKVETQNVNVPSCRFYAQQGCALTTVHRGAYQAFPDEVQLLWYKNLAAPDRGPESK